MYIHIRRENERSRVRCGGQLFQSALALGQLHVFYKQAISTSDTEQKTKISE